MNKPRQGISENFSDIASVRVKRRRGRPRIHVELRDECRAAYLFDSTGTERGKLNVVFMIRAMRALARESGVLFLFNESAAKRGKSGLKRTLLSELGRIENEDELRAVARELCSIAPRTADGVKLVRAWRAMRNQKGRNGAGVE